MLAGSLDHFLQFLFPIPDCSSTGRTYVYLVVLLAAAASAAMIYDTWLSSYHTRYDRALVPRIIRPGSHGYSMTTPRLIGSKVYTLSTLYYIHCTWYQVYTGTMIYSIHYILVAHSLTLRKVQTLTVGPIIYRVYTWLPSLIYIYTHLNIGIWHIFLATQSRDSFINICWYRNLCRPNFPTWRGKKGPTVKVPPTLTRCIA